MLGVSAYYHDSAAALIRDGRILAAAQEERFTRLKHDSSFPQHAIEYCLREGGCDLREVQHVAFYDKPFLKFERLLETYLAFAPRGFRSFNLAIPLWLKDKLFQKLQLARQLTDLCPGIDWEQRLLFSEHHLSHAASAFYPSPFSEAVVLTMDGVGEWATTSIAFGRENAVEVHKEIHFPHSIGLLYSAFTYYTGFKVNSGEYKLMGLAPYGVPRFVDRIYEHLIDLKEDGSFWMNQKYFDYCTGLTMTNKNFATLFGEPARKPETDLTQFHMDIAASVQKVTEEVLLRIVRSLAREYDCPNLCLAGGVALNCVANGLIARERCFENVWIQPASGDAGGAIGAALTTHYHHLGRTRSFQPPETDAMSGSYLGPAYPQEEIETALSELGATFSTLSEAEVVEACASGIAGESVVGWFQGRMEFGPRALGARSILGNAASDQSQRQINLKIKYRESFRPFAPAVLSEVADDWYELGMDSPYMLLVAKLRECHRLELSEREELTVGLEMLDAKRSTVPAVTHVDYSARVQTVHKASNPKFHALIKRVAELTGIPIVVNTSFNIRGEPIVCTPGDAYRCFMGTGMDMLAIGNCLLLKEEQDADRVKDYRTQFSLD